MRKDSKWIASENITNIDGTEIREYFLTIDDDSPNPKLYCLLSSRYNAQDKFRIFLNSTYITHTDGQTNVSHLGTDRATGPTRYCEVIPIH